MLEEHQWPPISSGTVVPSEGDPVQSQDVAIFCGYLVGLSWVTVFLDYLHLEEKKYDLFLTEVGNVLHKRQSVHCYCEFDISYCFNGLTQRNMSLPMRMTLEVTENGGGSRVPGCVASSDIERSAKNGKDVVQNHHEPTLFLTPLSLK